MLRLGLTTLETAILISIIAVGAAILLSTLSSMNLNVQKQRGLIEILYSFRGCDNIEDILKFVREIYHVKTVRKVNVSDGCKNCEERAILIRVIAPGTLSSIKIVGTEGSEIIQLRKSVSLAPGYYLLCLKYKESLGELVLREFKIPDFITVIVLSPQGPLIYK